ncbi:hypothetical protein [Nocardia amamiensis]
MITKSAAHCHVDRDAGVGENYVQASVARVGLARKIYRSDRARL